ncbi:2-iminoacetate synthase ThiH [Candidatus Saganbacteria bacterium]|nr:2-iminoacetate synthase ThiH [Candidatus Saganbacteria bacterium]
MTFIEIIEKIDPKTLLANTKECSENAVRKVLGKDKLDINDFVVLLCDSASKIVEELAQKANIQTLKNFGRTITMYAPLYINNECDNHCEYCGFSEKLEGKRISLSVAEVIAEANILYEKGFRHVLLVSGEKKDKITQEYLKEIIAKLHKQFDSIAIEIFPLEEEEYLELFNAGADSLTLYQEAYDRDVYKKFHLSGPKSDYNFRLLTPERAGRAGFSRISIGTLLGLSHWKEEAIYLASHAQYLKKVFWKSHISVSFPRLKSSAANFKVPFEVSDRELVQLICALRLFLPTIGLTLSTREDQALRDNLIPLGITQMSAESKTNPGGYGNIGDAEKQFEVSDKRSLQDVAASISNKGYEPVYKDWDREFIG